MKSKLHYLKLRTGAFVIMTVIPILSLQAQDYLISFEASSDTITLESVIVENLTQGTILEMKGNEVLHLKGVVPVFETISDNETGIITFYPNPMKEYARMQFVLPEPGETRINFYDLSGRQILQTRDKLSNGEHIYGIQGLEEGIYFVRIISGKYSYSGRIISSGSKRGIAKVVYENTMAIGGKQIDTKETKGTNAEKVFQYTTGDILKLTGISGKYRTVMTVVPTEGKPITFSFIACTDKDFNNYSIVQIGLQTWMAENLKTTKYNDGTAIDNLTDASAWSFLYSPAYCLWGNDAANKDVYGALYNWYAVSTGKLCPSGWHVSTDNDWKVLEGYIVGDSDANKLKETGTTHWPSPNSGATNATGFTALPGGHRGDLGSFYAKGDNGQFWCNSEYSYTNAWNRGIINEFSTVVRKNNSKVNGFSVRCLKDFKIVLRILDATSWTPENHNLSTVSNAVIKLYTSKASFDNNLPEFTTTSDANGMVQLLALPVQNQYSYLLIVEKGDLKNIKDGYIIGGVFNNSFDIFAWPTQTGAYIGALKYIDVNGDKVISPDDRIWYDTLTVNEDQTAAKIVIIGK
ncbi:MAG TPA: hypothetical protein DDW27_13215 [Bacteroidales bacterium]|nr:hypothetical protein [Bacteroidales bacterium]